MEVTAVEMDGQTVLMQDCPQCHGRGAVDLVKNGRKVWGGTVPGMSRTAGSAVLDGRGLSHCLPPAGALPVQTEVW